MKFIYIYIYIYIFNLGSSFKHIVYLDNELTGSTTRKRIDEYTRHRQLLTNFLK